MEKSTSEIDRLRKVAIHLELVDNYRALRKLGFGSSDKLKRSKSFLKKNQRSPSFSARHQALKEEYVRVLRSLLTKRIYRVFPVSKILQRLEKTRILLESLKK